MTQRIYSLAEAALQGDWDPLITAAQKAPGKYWAEEANCADHDIELFFPLGDGPREDPVEAAERLSISLVRPLNLCASCPLPIAARCLIDSIKHDDEWGIRAGLLASERSALRATWKRHVDEKVVENALLGATAPLSKGAREEVIARFAANPSALEPTAVARALGVTHEYLLKLARRKRQRSQGSRGSQPAASLSAEREADAA
jgi:WhiB family transcriptional regulator, redox-sensing transcriptional regulator